MTTKILVADDSATMRRVLEMTFAGEDAEVLAVDSGEAALAKAGEITPDVLFVDASMSLDGYEVAKKVKANPALAGTAVVVMASQHNPYDEGRGRACGVDDHISKPFDTQSVIDRVGQVLGRPRVKSAGGAEGSSVAKPPAPSPAAVPPPAAAAAPPPAPAAPAATRRSSVGAPRPAAPAMPRPAGHGTVAGIGMTPPAQPPSPSPAPAPARPAPAPAAKPQPSSPAPAAVARATEAGSPMADRLSGLGLSKEQVDGVLALSREVIEQVVWEVVPELAETLIKEEIRRLTSD